LQGLKTGEAWYKNDLKDSTWHIWDDNGRLRYEMHYSEGRKIGKWVMWDENGQITQVKDYGEGE
jgi:antitoxin component YwqK of YwqJK toxin-antitoxin module